MFDFNYSKEEQIIPLPECDEDDIQEKFTFIDENRISNIPVVSTSPFLNPAFKSEEEESESAKKQMHKE